MTFKKCLVIGMVSLAALSATATQAGGVDDNGSDVASDNAAFQSQVYVDLHGGYAKINWADFNASGVLGTSANSYFSPTDNRFGGFMGGLDVGYTFRRSLALDMGWMYLPRVNGDVTSNGTSNSVASGATMKVRSWLAYAAARVDVVLNQSISVFGKVGVGYRDLDYTAPSSPSELATGTKNGHYWAPVFAVGMQYAVENWRAGFQYMYLPANKDKNDALTGGLSGYGAPNAAPEASIYTIYLGYQFPA